MSMGIGDVTTDRFGGIKGPSESFELNQRSKLSEDEPPSIEDKHRVVQSIGTKMNSYRWVWGLGVLGVEVRDLKWVV